jgi:hypothetical protein
MYHLELYARMLCVYLPIGGCERLEYRPAGLSLALDMAHHPMLGMEAEVNLSEQFLMSL